MRKENAMPTEDDLERRLWRTMPWDESVMAPSAEQEALEDEEGESDE